MRFQGFKHYSGLTSYIVSLTGKLLWQQLETNEGGGGGGLQFWRTVSDFMIVLEVDILPHPHPPPPPSHHPMFPVPLPPPPPPFFFYCFIYFSRKWVGGGDGCGARGPAFKHVDWPHVSSAIVSLTTLQQFLFCILFLFQSYSKLCDESQECTYKDLCWGPDWRLQRPVQFVLSFAIPKGKGSNPWYLLLTLSKQWVVLDYDQFLSKEQKSVRDHLPRECIQTESIVLLVPLTAIIASKIYGPISKEKYVRLLCLIAQSVSKACLTIVAGYPIGIKSIFDDCVQLPSQYQKNMFDC